MLDKTAYMIAEMAVDGTPADYIATMMGMEEARVAEILADQEVMDHIAVRQAEAGEVIPDQDLLKRQVEAMYQEALTVVRTAMSAPKAVSTVQWSAAQWVLSKAAAIQEMSKDVEGAKVVNQFIIGDKAAVALDRMTKELGQGDWRDTLEASMGDLPEGVQ